MPDIQMILDAPQATQVAASASSPGASGGSGEVFGKALNQAKTAINEKAPQPDGARGRKKALESVASQERAGAAKGEKRARAKQRADVPNLPMRGPSEKQETNNGTAGAKLDKWADHGKPLGRQEWGQSAEKIVPPQAKVGTAASEMDGHGPTLTVTSEHNAHLNGLARQQANELARQWAAEAAGQSGEGGQGGQNGQLAAEAAEGWLLKAWWDAMIERPNEQDEENPDGSQPEKGLGAAQEPVDEDEAAAPDIADNANAAAKAMEAIKGAARLTLKNASAEDIWLEITEEAAKELHGSPSAERAKVGADRLGAHAEKLAAEYAAEQARTKGQARTAANGPHGEKNPVAAEAASSRPGHNNMAPRSENQGLAVPASDSMEPKMAPQTNIQANPLANIQAGHQAAEGKGMAEAALSLGLRHDASPEIDPAAEKNAALAGHAKNGNAQTATTAPIEIESALPMQNGGPKAKGAKETGEAKGEKELSAQRTQGEDASVAKAAPSKHQRANFRAEASESEEQDSKALDQGRATGQRHLQARGAKDAAEEAARRPIGDGSDKGRAAKEAGAAPRGRRHAPAGQGSNGGNGGQDGLGAIARDAAKSAPPPMRMDAAPQSRAESAAKAGQSGPGNQASQNAQNGPNVQANQNGHSGQDTEGGQSNQGSQGQGQGQGAAHKGAGEKIALENNGFEKNETKFDAATAKASGSMGHSAHSAADAKPVALGGSNVGQVGQALPGAPVLPGAEQAGHAQAANGKLPLPPQAPMAQMDGSVKWMLRNEQQAAEIQLYPEHLGKVTIRLRVEGNEVHARVWASEASTLPVLREQRAYLESSLKEQGLQLSSFDLQHGKGGQQANSEGQNRPQGQHFHFGAQVIESWNGSEFRQEMPTKGTPQIASQGQDSGRIELYA
jgi:flagellar hook-length control protein FliK